MKSPGSVPSRAFAGAGPPGFRRSRGFSLIEILLASTLLAVIMGLAYSGFQASTRATMSGEKMIERTNSIRVAHQFLRRQLSLSMPLVMEEEEGPDGFHIVFEGDSDRVRFVAPMPGYLSHGGPYVQELRLESGRNGQDLVFNFAILTDYEPGDLDYGETVTLLEGLRSAEFRYIGFDEEGEITGWSSLWEDWTRLPLAVSLEMELEDERMEWPDMTAKLLIDAGGTARQGQRQPVRAPNRSGQGARR